MKDLNKDILVNLIQDGLKRVNKSLEEQFDEEIAKVRRNDTHASILLEMRSGKKFLVTVNKA